MYYRNLSYALLLFLLVIPFKIKAWGFFAHKKINHIAVFTLPPEMFGFYKQNIEFISEHAIDPDKRRYAFDEEAGRHFIDLDRYEKDSLPLKYEDAALRYGEDSLQAHGIVPWHIVRVLRQLCQAFKEENHDRILRLSADLGHYLADAHVPLHTTKNYNGQLTNQRGIHGFWESRLPELFNEDYDYFIGKAKYIEDPLSHAWKIIRESYAAKDSVLQFESDLNNRFPRDRKYSYEQRGNALVRVFSKEYSDEYHRMMNGMVERRLRAAIASAGSFWMTAWIDAGQPDLNKQKDKVLNPETEKEIQEEAKKYNEGNLKGKSCD